MLYDQLVKLDNLGTPKLALAKSITPNTDFTRWVITLRDGVEFHNGKKVTATDVLFSIARIIKGKYAGAVGYGPIDLSKCHVINASSLVLEFKTPYAQLVQFMAAQLGTSPIVPTNFDPRKPVGTGPFKLVSFTPGVQSIMVRNPNYWDRPAYLDQIVLVDLTDETAQISALQTGQADIVNFLSASSVATVKAAGMKTWISQTGATVPFTMRTDIAPFNDVRVRQAFRLIVDRKQMLEQVYSGFGSIGNDVFGRYDTYYDKSLPQREQDIAQAKSLLKAAGKEGMAVDLPTSTLGPGCIETAVVFATQAKKAGVKVTIKQSNPTDFYATSYLHAPFTQEYWNYIPYLPLAEQSYVPPAPYNSTFRDDPAYNALYRQASATKDKTKLESITHQMMKMDYDSGGHIIPTFFPSIAASSPKVHGITTSVLGYSPGGCDWASYWID